MLLLHVCFFSPFSRHDLQYSPAYVVSLEKYLFNTISPNVAHTYSPHFKVSLWQIQICCSVMRVCVCVCYVCVRWFIVKQFHISSLYFSFRGSVEFQFLINNRFLWSLLQAAVSGVKFKLASFKKFFFFYSE